MIKLTRLNHAPVVLNSDLIEHIDETPDTVITLTSGQKLRVLESAEDIVAKVIEFRSDLSSQVAMRGGCACAIPYSAPRATAAQESTTHG